MTEEYKMHFVTKFMLLVTVFLSVVQYSEALSCYCKNPCKKPTGCKAGTVVGPCCSCRVCAKVRNERCGGPWWVSGRCAKGLTCKKVVKPGQNEFNVVGKCVCTRAPCYRYCPYGFAIGKAGCPICKCKKLGVCIDPPPFGQGRKLRKCQKFRTVLCSRNCNRCCRTRSCLKNRHYPKRRRHCPRY